MVTATDQLEQPADSAPVPAPTTAAQSQVFALPQPPSTGTTALTLNIPPPPAARIPPFSETPAATAVATMLGVIATVGFGIWSTFKQLENAKAETAKRRSEELTDAANKRNAEQADAAAYRQHEKDEAQLDRLMNSRREVYADLVDKFIGVQSFFGRMKGLSLDDPKFALELRELGAPVNKTWLLSEPETAYEARELYSLLNEQYLKILPRLGPIADGKGAISRLEGRLAAVDAQIENLRAAQPLNQGAVNGLLASRQSVQNELIAAHPALGKLFEEFDRELFGYQTETMQRVNSLMACARKELGLVGDSTILDQQSVDMTNRMLAAMEAFHASITTREHSS